MDNRIDVCRFKDKRKRKADFPDLKGAFEMKCSQLLEHIEYTCLQGSTDVKVSAVVNDSRKIEEGCLDVYKRQYVQKAEKNSFV